MKDIGLCYHGEYDRVRREASGPNILGEYVTCIMEVTYCLLCGEEQFSRRVNDENSNENHKQTKE